MRAALREAAMASGASRGDQPGAAASPGPGAGLPRGDVPVGAVVLDAAGAIIARGRNRREADRDPTAHAEIVALRRAAQVTGSWRLAGCTLVVTLEPCTRCAGAVSAARIDRLVYGAPDPRAGAAGSLWDVLRDRRLGQQIEVIGGVLATESASLLRDFFAERRPADS